MISQYATDLLSDLSPRQLCRIPSTPEGRKLTRQFSFTRTVPAKIKLKRSGSSLYDGATPIIMADDDNVFDEVFDNAVRNSVKEENGHWVQPSVFSACY